MAVRRVPNRPSKMRRHCGFLREELDVRGRDAVLLGGEPIEPAERMPDRYTAGVPVVNACVDVDRHASGTVEPCEGRTMLVLLSDRRVQTGRSTAGLLDIAPVFAPGLLHSACHAVRSVIATQAETPAQISGSRPAMSSAAWPPPDTPIA